MIRFPSAAQMARYSSTAALKAGFFSSGPNVTVTRRLCASTRVDVTTKMGKTRASFFTFVPLLEDAVAMRLIRQPSQRHGRSSAESARRVGRYGAGCDAD